MFHEFLDQSESSPREPVRSRAPVTDIATRRRSDNLLHSITLVFGGIHYGTFSTEAPSPKGKPIVLYLVPAAGQDDDPDTGFSGPLDCLITDDAALGLRRAAR